MRWTVGKGEAARMKADLLVVPVYKAAEGPDLSPLRGLNRSLGGALTALAAGGAFNAAAESTQLIPGGRAAAPWILAVGLGPRDDLSAEILRRAAATASREARRVQARRLVALLPDLAGTGLAVDAAARCWTEGGELGLSDSGTEKTGDRVVKDLPRECRLLPPAGAAPAEVRAGMNEGLVFAEGALFARRLVNLPANLLDPDALAAEARGLARREGLDCRVLGKSQLKRMGMGGVLGVAQGSRRDPRFIVLESRGVAARRPLVALVGKGVTFDSGGISIKPSAKMHEMKADMGGAAAVLGAALIISRLRLPVRLLAVVPAVENMPDGDAIRPGDVLKMASGKTVEVLNTDAEGRLILADALHFACKRKPDWVIDAATLTGACVVALGSHFAGLMGNDGALAGALERAGGETFERTWPLPVIEDHHKALESQVADLQNLGGRDGGALTAAAFLEEFVPEATAWAHLDIAGPAWVEAGGPVMGKGGTGFGARLIARAVQLLAAGD